MVTKDLEKAFDQASKLPEKEQEQFAAWILEELRAERRWSRALAADPAKLASLAGEAAEEYAVGESEELNPDEL
jgi:hypothetical protein